MSVRGIALSLLAFALVCRASAALAASPVGEWLVEDKDARIAIRPCGAALCGKITWTPDGEDIGVTILKDMQVSADGWVGSIYDPRDKTTYLGHIFLQADDALKVDGCVLGGAICGGEVWTRYK